MITVDIQPQWRKLAKWYWDSCEGKDVQDRGMSIWEMLEENYGAFKAFNINHISSYGMQVQFPTESSYVAFLLKWG